MRRHARRLSLPAKYVSAPTSPDSTSNLIAHKREVIDLDQLNRPVHGANQAVSDWKYTCMFFESERRVAMSAPQARSDRQRAAESIFSRSKILGSFSILSGEPCVRRFDQTVVIRFGDTKKESNP